MKKLVLIDSNAIIHRAYHALPKNMSTSTGKPTNAVYGYTTTLIKVLEDLKPDYIAATFDIGKATYRTQQFVDYKAHRVAADQELYDQIPMVKELLETLKIPVYEKEGYEADDIIGTIVSKCHSCENGNPETGCRIKSGMANDANLSIYIITGDKDLFQLLNGRIFVYWLKKGLSESAIVDSKKIKEEFNLDPTDFIDLKALAGDPSDNIPGVPGIGPKTATTLLQKYDTLENIYLKIIKSLEKTVAISNSKSLISNQFQILNELKINNSELYKNLELGIKNLSDKDFISAAHNLQISPRILKLLINNMEQAFLSQQLATICREVPMEFNLEDCKWGNYNKEEVRKFFEKMQFHSLLRRFGVEPAKEVKTKEALEQKKKDEQLKLL